MLTMVGGFRFYSYSNPLYPSLLFSLVVAFVLHLVCIFCSTFRDPENGLYPTLVFFGEDSDLGLLFTVRSCHDFCR
jgi:hypothetical protein